MQKKKGSPAPLFPSEYSATADSAGETFLAETSAEGVADRLAASAVSECCCDSASIMVLQLPCGSNSCLRMN
jgi:hypothetical protein